MLGGAFDQEGAGKEIIKKRGGGKGFSRGLCHI